MSIEVQILQIPLDIEIIVEFYHNIGDNVDDSQ